MLVSCVVPTRNRPRWIAQSIHYFQRQDYPDKEMIIVAESTDHVQPPDDPRIRVITADGSVGTKRNFGCTQAQGDILVHWDDDDWYGPQRLSRQVAPILSGEADATGIIGGLIFLTRNWQFLRCRIDIGRDQTYSFRRRFFGPCQYGIYNPSEIKQLICSMQDHRAIYKPVLDDGDFIYVRHGQTVMPAPESLPSDLYEVIPEPASLLSDRGFYHD